MARTQAFFLLYPKSQNSQDTHTSDYKEPRGRKMSSRDEGVRKVKSAAELFLKLGYVRYYLLWLKDYFIL